MKNIATFSLSKLPAIVRRIKPGFMLIKLAASRAAPKLSAPTFESPPDVSSFVKPYVMSVVRLEKIGAI